MGGLISARKPQGQRGLGVSFTLLTEDLGQANWLGPKVKELLDIGRHRRGAPNERRVKGILQWMVRWSELDGLFTHAADLLESALAGLDGEKHDYVREKRILSRVTYLNELARFTGSPPGPTETTRIYGLRRWYQQRSAAYPELPIDLNLFIGAMTSGAFPDADSAAREFTDLLIGPACRRQKGSLLAEACQPSCYAALSRSPTCARTPQCAREDS